MQRQLQTINIDKIKINPRYKAIAQSTSYEWLEKDIITNGVTRPVILNADLVLLNGHTRVEICQKHKKDLPKLANIPYEILTLDSEADEVLFVARESVTKELTDYQRYELFKLIGKIEEEKQKAKQRQKQGTLVGNQAKGRAREILADQLGTSPDKVQKMIQIDELATEDQKEKLRKGAAIDPIYREIVKKERLAKTPRLPRGVFNILLVDPPWQYTNTASRGAAENHYNTMSTRQICNFKKKMKRHIAKHAMLFLWATNPMLPDGLKVMKGWGFEYKAHFVWDKRIIGTGNYVRNEHELLLIGRRGKIPTPLQTDVPRSIIRAPRSNHSTKPNVVYDLIQQMYPKQKYLELFSRNKAGREGWTMWGNELPANNHVLNSLGGGS